MIASQSDIVSMRAAGQLAAQLLQYLGSHVKAGVSTMDLDRLADQWTAMHGATSAPLNYSSGGKDPFPAHACFSKNSIICHGIPREDDILANGDILNIDVTPILNGYHGDTSLTFAVGDISEEKKDLIRATEECLFKGIAAAVPGGYLGTIGHEISSHAKARKYEVNKVYCGHGIGRRFHTQPYVPHYGTPNTGLKLVPGMIFTIEPILCRGDPAIQFLNEWESETVSGAWSAQAEHTILITEHGNEILTWPQRI